MELGVPLRGSETVLREYPRVIQVHGRIETAAGRVVVDHFYILADRTY
jgi:hypothetical protein